MGLYKISFVLNGKANTIQLSSEVDKKTCPVSFSLIRERLKYRNKNYSSFELNAIGHVLYKYPDATQFEIETIDDKRGMLLILAFVIALIIAPILITLGMFGKFILKGVYKNAATHPKYKKFRKGYIIISFSLFAVCIALLIVFVAIGGDLPVSLPLYILVGVNVIGFIITLIHCKKLAKEAPKVDSGAVKATNSVNIEKNNEVSALLLKYKELLDKNVISEEEYEKLRSSAMSMMVEEECIQEDVLTEITQETPSFDTNVEQSLVENDTVETFDEPIKETKPRVKKKLFSLDYPFEGAENNLVLNKWFKQYRINSFVLAASIIVGIVLFIVTSCLSFSHNFYYQLALLFIGLIFTILLATSHSQGTCSVFKFFILLGLFYYPGFTGYRSIIIIMEVLFAGMIIYTLIIIFSTSSKTKHETLLYKKEHLEENPYEELNEYYKWDISKLDSKNKWVAGIKINSYSKLDRVSFCFMCVFLFFAAFSFAFIFVPWTIETPDGLLTRCPIMNDSHWRLVLIFTSFGIMVIMLVLRAIFMSRKNSAIFELFFGICAPVFLLFNSLSLYSAYGNWNIALLDAVGAGILAVFYIAILSTRLTMKKNIEKFVASSSVVESESDSAE